MTKQHVPETQETDELSLVDIERGQRIKQARVKANFSTGQFAEAMGLTSGAISQWEHGRTKPNRERLKKLCDLLNCSPAWIEGRSQDSDGGSRRFVPLFSMELAASNLPSWDVGDISADNGVQVLERCSDSAFAVKIGSKRYLPAVSYGAVLVIDPAIKQEIQPSDVVFATTSKGQPELLQAFHVHPLAHVHRGMNEYDIDPALRAQVMKILLAAQRLIYLHLEDGRRADMTEMRVIGPVIQKTEGRVWPGMNRAVLAYASAAMSDGVGLAGDLARTPEVDDVAQGFLPSKDRA